MKKTGVNTIVVLCILLLCACSSGNRTKAGAEGGKVEKNLYAKGFGITRFKDYSTVSIADPWDTTKILQNYILVEKGAPLPRNLPQGTVIRIPIENAIMYTVVHTSVLEQLGALDAVAGICETQYLNSPRAKEAVRSGRIADCGLATAPNVEKIMDIGGEIIIASPFEHGGYGQVEKLGVPIFESADYMETHPLGRVEWMKVYGMLLGKEAEADSMFQGTVARYNAIRELASKAEKRPRLMVERKYGSSWFIPGGASYMATMYKDAGADYIFNDLNETGSVPYPFERVYERGLDADIWLLKYSMDRDMTYNDLLQEYKPYGDFAPFWNRNIHACNTTQSSYYETISIHPDYILADFLHIFHPELLPEHELICYKPMGEAAR